MATWRGSGVASTSGGTVSKNSINVAVRRAHIATIRRRHGIDEKRRWQSPTPSAAAAPSRKIFRAALRFTRLPRCAHWRCVRAALPFLPGPACCTARTARASSPDGCTKSLTNSLPLWATSVVGSVLAIAALVCGGETNAMAQSKTAVSGRMKRLVASTWCGVWLGGRGEIMVNSERRWYLARKRRTGTQSAPGVASGAEDENGVTRGAKTVVCIVN